MKINLVDERGIPITEPYTIRFHGWTEERYFKDAPQDRKCEYVRGEVIVFSPMTYDHNDVVEFLCSLLRMYGQARSLGTALPGPTIRFAPEVNREPDICFFTEENLPRTSKMPLSKIPPFAIEVSFTTRDIDLGEKARDYENAGVEEYWVVDLEGREVHLHRLVDGKYKVDTVVDEKVESTIVSGFFIETSWLWERPLPNSYQCLQLVLGE